MLVLNLMWGQPVFLPNHWLTFVPVLGITLRLPTHLLSHIKVSFLRVAVFHPSLLWAVPGPMQMSLLLLSFPPTTTYSVLPPVGSPELSLDFQPNSLPSWKVFFRFFFLPHLQCRPTFWEAWASLNNSSWGKATASACGEAACVSEPANSAPIKAISL